MLQLEQSNSLAAPEPGMPVSCSALQATLLHLPPARPPNREVDRVPESLRVWLLNSYKEIVAWFPLILLKHSTKSKVVSIRKHWLATLGDLQFLEHNNFTYHFNQSINFQNMYRKFSRRLSTKEEKTSVILVQYSSSVAQEAAIPIARAALEVLWITIIYNTIIPIILFVELCKLTQNYLANQSEILL